MSNKISLEKSLAQMPRHLCFHHPNKKAEWVIEEASGDLKMELFVCWDCFKDTYNYNGKPIEHDVKREVFETTTDESPIRSFKVF